jgi:hypothetical protein
MEFLKYLDETEESKEYNAKSDTKMWRMFEKISLTKTLDLSIQASAAHYCRPRTTMDYLNEYSHMEIALMDENQDFVTITEVCPEFASLTEIESYCDGSIYAYVPVDLVDELFQYYVLKRSERTYD